MHEYSIVEALIGRVEELAAQHRARHVRRVLVSIGELSGVERDLLETAYATFRERTVCERADLAIRPVPARWECTGCGQPIARGQLLSCPRCGVPARLAAGDEIVLDRVEMEVA